MRDETCRVAIVALVRALIAGSLPVDCRPLMLPSLLIPVETAPGKIRPIAIGQCFYRIASSLSIRKIAPKLRSILKHHQYAVAVRAGCESAVHILQAILDLDHSVLLSVDVANAFNSMDRAHVLESLYSHDDLSPIFQLADFAYSTPSSLIVRNSRGKVVDVIMSECGVRQGDPLGLALFALGLLGPIHRALEVDENLNLKVSWLLLLLMM